MKDYKEKMSYLEIVVEPGLEEAFKRGDEKFHGLQHHAHPRILDRRPDEDIRHVRELHVDVRLREAEDAADGEDLDKALEKIESAMGYLILLHYRINAKNDPELGE